MVHDKVGRDFRRANSLVAFSFPSCEYQRMHGCPCCRRCMPLRAQRWPGFL